MIDLSSVLRSKVPKFGLRSLGILVTCHLQEISNLVVESRYQILSFSISALYVDLMIAAMPLELNKMT